MDIYPVLLIRSGNLTNKNGFCSVKNGLLSPQERAALNNSEFLVFRLAYIITISKIGYKSGVWFAFVFHGFVMQEFATELQDFNFTFLAGNLVDVFLITE